MVHILILALALPMFQFCSRFEELNTDPDNPGQVSAPLLASGLILGTVSYPRIGKDFLYKDMLAKYISYMEGATGYQYNLINRTEFYSLVKLTNVEKMVDAADGTVSKNSYIALGHFVRAYTFFDLSMRVGDIPYSEALQGENGIYNPRYDNQRDIFLGILHELEMADSLFGIAGFFEGDPVYNGNPAKWQKATNNLALKILLHLWKKTADPELDVIRRFDDIVRNNHLMESASDNFQLVFSEREVEFYPFYNSNFRKYPVISSTISDRMKNLKDYRLFYFAEPADSLLRTGHPGSEWDAYSGVNPSDDFSEINAHYASGAISGLNKRYYSLAQGEPLFLLSFQEQCFIIAEGILRGWTNGDTAGYYYQGIRSAFQFIADHTPDDSLYHHGRKITPEVIETYLLEDAVSFTGSTEDKLDRIALQRYFLGFMQDGINSYFEYRRAGKPAWPVNELTNLNSMKDRIPLRWMYPMKELTNNKKNVEEAITRQYSGNDDVNARMWILNN
ncbi:MAG: SusD/RagB family nutrient-binding outer membrane lipoprotein [Bacteroidales bacterium]